LDDSEFDMLLLLGGRGPLGDDDDRRTGDEGRALVALLAKLLMLLFRNPVSILLPLAAVPTPAILDNLISPNSPKSSVRESPRVCASRGTSIACGWFLSSLVVR